MNPPPVEPSPEARARMLLNEHLSVEQRQQLDRHGWFGWFVVKVGRRAYRIGPGVAVTYYTSSGVQLIKRGPFAPPWVPRLGTTINAWPRGGAYGYDYCSCALPRYDVALGQKLWLEHDERSFLRIGCFS